MADDNLSPSGEPVVTTLPTPPTEDQLVEDISNLLDDPTPDPVEDEPDEAAAPPEEDDDPLGLGAEDVDADTADAPDESQDAEIKGGRFAPDSAKVTLDDGSVMTIAELKRGTLFQRDYTKKTQELSEERKSFEAEREKVSQYAQSLDQSREYLTWYAEQHLPKQPVAPTDPNDFVGWHNYRLEVDKWNEHVQAYQRFQADKAADSERKAGETQQEKATRLKRESEALFKALPVLKDPVKGAAAWNAIVAGAGQYGFTPEEVNAFEDHRFALVIRDALGYRRVKAAAPKVQDQVTKKPAVRDGRRAPPNAAQSREKQARSERLRNSGSFEAGVAALSDFDL
jgi:hypothetical protein